MPIPVTKYRCKFKCGHRAISDKKDMITHEQNHCFKNPESKTCETCINRIYESDYDEFTVWHRRGCKIDTMNIFLEDIQGDLTMDNHHVKPLWGCPNHNKSEDIPETEEYLRTIRGRIEAKKKETEEIKTLPF